MPTIIDVGIVTKNLALDYGFTGVCYEVLGFFETFVLWMLMKIIIYSILIFP